MKKNLKYLRVNKVKLGLKDKSATGGLDLVKYYDDVDSAREERLKSR